LITRTGAPSRACRGLPAIDPEQVFTPFFTTKAGGSGIGLTLARRIAFAHGGLLMAAANSPQGTVFSLNLPSGGESRS
jgi:signal transduction histidine kinase